MIILYDKKKKKKDSGLNELPVYEVVDGQQRLTSISLLAGSIILELKKWDLEDKYKNIIERLHDFIMKKDEDFQQITLGNINKKYYESFIELVNEEREKLPEA